MHPATLEFQRARRAAVSAREAIEAHRDTFPETKEAQKAWYSRMDALERPLVRALERIEEALCKIAAHAAEEGEALAAGVKAGSWDTTFKDIRELPAATDKPLYTRVGDESWGGTWTTIAALETIEPVRTLKSASDAGVEPVTKASETMLDRDRLQAPHSGECEVKRQPRSNGLTVTVPSDMSGVYRARLSRVALLDSWHTAAIEAAGLLDGEMSKFPMANSFTFAAPSDPSIWWLVSNPNFENVFRRMCRDEEGM